jgi:hypothetical protein
MGWKYGWFINPNPITLHNTLTVHRELNGTKQFRYSVFLKLTRTAQALNNVFLHFPYISFPLYLSLYPIVFLPLSQLSYIYIQFSLTTSCSSFSFLSSFISFYFLFLISFYWLKKLIINLLYFCFAFSSIFIFFSFLYSCPLFPLLFLRLLFLIFLLLFFCLYFSFLFVLRTSWSLALLYATGEIPSTSHPHNIFP